MLKRRRKTVKIKRKEWREEVWRGKEGEEGEGGDSDEAKGETAG